MTPEKWEHIRLLNRIAELGPECEALAKSLLVRQVAFGHEILDLYDEADEDEQKDMRAFCDGGGPRFCQELRVQHEDGTPTSRDLEDWLK